MSESPKRPRSASEALQALSGGAEIELENKLVTQFLEAIKKHQPGLTLYTAVDKINSGWTVISKEKPVKEKPTVRKQAPDPFVSMDSSVSTDAMFERFTIRQRIKNLVELYAKRNLLDRKEKADFRFLDKGVEAGKDTKKYNLEGLTVYIRVVRNFGITIEYSDKLVKE
jgi:hypothetical protein